jgi:membrane protease YdiL (CAAX protease family)
VTDAAPDGLPPHSSELAPLPAGTVRPPAILGPTSILAPRARLVAVAEILLCSTVPTQTVIGFLLLSAGWSPITAEGHYSLPFVLTLSLGDTVVLIALMTLLTRAHGESPTALWLGDRPVRGEMLRGLLLIPVVFVMVVVLLTVLRMLAPWLHTVPDNPLEQLARGGPMEAAMFGLVAIFAGGVREELQRAFMLRRFEEHLGGPAVGVVVWNIAFGLGHLQQGLDAVVTTAVLGGFWSVIYLRRRSSVAPVVSHAGFNSLEILRLAAGGS